MTSVSVAMATYNGARFLREQLDSIAAQTLLPAELVVTDDASSDDTVAIVRRFAETAPFPVRLHENPVQLGFRANFMAAMALCTSELIALCDQDDIWTVNKLERMLEALADPNVPLAFHEAWLIDSLGARIELAEILPLEARSPPSSLFPLHNPYGFSMVFRRDLLRFSDLWVKSVDNLKTDATMAHDQWLFFLASALGTIAYVAEPLAGYRQHGSNTYGVERRARTFRSRIARWINVRSKEFARFAVASRTRASILVDALGRMDPEWQARAGLAIARYQRLSHQCMWRAAVYESGLLGRFAAWFALLRDGAYGNRTRWTFGRKAALIDLTCLITPRWLLVALPNPERLKLPGDAHPSFFKSTE